MIHKNNEIDFETFGEENEEDLLIENLEVFNQAVIWGTDWTTETVVLQLEKGNIDLNPKFQRRDAWDDDDKSKLIESLILGLPVPPIILAEKKDEKNKYLVIDGKQRLLTLRQFCAKPHDEFRVLTLKHMQFLKSLNGKTHQEIEENIEFSQYRTSFENQIIRTIVIKNWPNEKFLYSVFLRLNTGSKQLSPQELRQALHPGEFLDFLDGGTGNSDMFMKIFRSTSADPRMRDVELALRFFAFKYFVHTYTGNLKEFLDDTCKKLNEEWNREQNHIKEDFFNLEGAIECTFNVFGEREAFSRWNNGKFNCRFNRALYEVFSFYFSIPTVRDVVTIKKEEFKDAFISLSRDDSEFNNSISSTTKDINKTVYRYTRIYEMLSKILEVDIPKLDLKDGRIIVSRVR